jgi:hypothetical protein
MSQEERMPGARNNKRDAENIGKVRSLAGEIQAIADDLLRVEPETGTIFLIKGAGDELWEMDNMEIEVGQSAVLAIKSGDDWVLDVLGVPFGSPSQRDSDHQWFDASTKFYLDKFPSPPAVYYHGFEDVGKPSGEPVFLGSTLSTRKADEGLWFRVKLDKSVPHAKTVWEAALQGNARASSGSIAHLSRVTKSGHIAVWPVAELSLFETSGRKRPANPYAVVLPAAKSLYATAGLPLDIETLESELNPEGEQHSGPGTEGSTPPTKNFKGVVKMDPEEVQKLVAQSVKDALKAQEDAAAAEKARQDEVQKTVEAALKSQREQLDAAHQEALKSAAAGRRLPGGDAPYVTKFEEISQFDDVEIADLAVIAGITGAAKMAGKGPGPSENLRRALAIRIQDSDEGKVGYGPTKSAMKMAGMPVKSDELNRSTLASYGDEWISVAYSSQLWDKIRLGAPIAAKLPTIVVPQGAESIIIPIQSTSPTFYTVAQTTDQAANPGRVTPKQVTSRMGSGKVQLSVNKLGAAVNYTGELEEDSLIPWASELRRDLTAEASEVLEHIVIDGDTAAGATTNINDIGGTPAGTEAFMLLNGFRKLCLVTNTANSRSAGTLDISDFLETIKLMGLAGSNAQDKSKVGFILDMWTNWKVLELAEVKTRDVFVAPTVENGVLTNIFGYDVMGSANMHRANLDATYGYKANASGKIDLDTASNNTTGSILAVRWDQWRFGMKRRMTFEIDRDPLSDSTLIVCMMRVGLLARDNEASAISYNVTL